MSKVVSSLVVVGAIASSVPNVALAIGGASGPKLTYNIPGKIGEIIVNPYGLAPLTAVIKNGGYELKNAKVTVVGKKGGVDISYNVADKHLRTHAGIPVFGLYADYQNTVNVEYDRIFNGKVEKIKETYKIYAAPIYGQSGGGGTGLFFSNIDVKKVDPAFKNRLYFVNDLGSDQKGMKVVWNNPSGGALEWNYEPQNFIIDTKGEVRWYMLPNQIHDMQSIFKNGVMMGFRQNTDGALSWGFGQRYVKYDIMGREIFNRKLPESYNDYSHFMYPATAGKSAGHYFMRVASSNYKRPDGKNVRTVRDVIVEVDENGKVVDDWKLFEILDPYRSNIIKVLDQGAVCLNIDASKAGHTMSAEELAKLDESNTFGDVTGSGAGRNWAHVNSVWYDAEDDSIIISSRHQSAMVKIGRDKKVKWIVGAHKGWKDQFKPFLLQPVDEKGNKIVCDDEYTKCPGYTNKAGGFDWTWTQHTAFKIDAKSKGDILYLSAFDNGDSRGMEQPTFPTDKYSRAVIYKIDQKKMTIEQIWEYGKNRGHSYYSPITSITEFHPDTNSVLVYSATAGLNMAQFARMQVSPILQEFKWNPNAKTPEKEPAVELQFSGTPIGYQALPFDIKSALSK
ncbi:aryl-sulfate sulfotransferase [uncultured Helicobacter sp.]|uniref:aryl-sulfate sulfotransferase n=1 Tax=uncultured Helicobacter sp. TaxID=175537 RepID=UPI0035A886F2